MSEIFYFVLAVFFIILIVLILCCCCFCCYFSKRKKTPRDVEAQHEDLEYLRGLYGRVVPPPVPPASVRLVTRAEAIQALIDVRERSISDENVNPCTADRERLSLIEQAVTAILDPTARAVGERNDVDLDLHRFRKRDAEALVKLLIQRARNEMARDGVGVEHEFAAFGVRTRVLRVDTGRGTHSDRGPVLQRAVRALLEQSRFRFDTLPNPQEGVFLIDPLTGDFDALDAVFVDEI